MKRIISFLLTIMLLSNLVAVPVSAAEGREITVLLNGEKLEFDVPPMLINNRTMVPMRAIFEALGAKITWSSFNETVTGAKLDGTRIVTSIGSYTATVDDKAVEIDSPPVLINGRTLVPLRFVSEAFDCTVGWDDATSTVTITSNTALDRTLIYLDNSSYDTLGGWSASGDHMMLGKTTQIATDVTTDDAIAHFSVINPGDYKVWVRAKDYATNQPGTRYYNASVDGVRSNKTFGQHGSDEYVWEDAGTFNLASGVHEFRLHDTSAFYARCEGVIITDDVNYVPTGDFSEYTDYVIGSSMYQDLIPSNYPTWTTKQLTDAKVETIENDKIKMVFYQGYNERGNVVQNEIFMMKNGEWQLVKARDEELGVLAMRADESETVTSGPRYKEFTEPRYSAVTTKFTGFNDTVFNSTGVKSYYKMAKPEWLIPSGVEKTADGKIKLTASSENVDATITYSFDSLSYEPKVTFDAKIKTKGAYSFAHFSGDDFKDDSFEQVTAPLHFVQKEIPEYDYVIEESALFTPMCTFTFKDGEDFFTKGVAVDPTSVRQYYARPGDTDFGVLFRSPNGNARAHVVAPIFGAKQCLFEENSDYSFSYRLVYSNEDWYETMEHIAVDLFNCKDVRTNYYASLNEAIYNTTDLIMDDIYGGWDDRDKGYYNMEVLGVATQSNFPIMVQRYLLTENEEYLTERAIPSIAAMLSRGGSSFTHYEKIEDGTYTSEAPTRLKGVYDTGESVFAGLYHMSQGRTPYLLNYAISKNPSEKIRGASFGDAMNELLDSDDYTNNITKAADRYIEVLEEETFVTPKGLGGFVYGDTVPMLNTFVKAYETTKEQKYLDAATEIAEYIMTEIWTTGYQNDYATTDYTVDPEETASHYLSGDNPVWFFHDDTQWRVGNPYGVVTLAKDAQNQLKEETGPGWLPAKAGLGTEHPITPGNGKAIYMNMWAGTMLRLAKYTGNDFFRTQARNAVIGRFANYPGYYVERNLLHDKQERFPYDGPDYNLIYWHHIPVFLAMLEDFLINDVWDRSNMNIEFPSFVNTGYAYFDSNQYGHEAGKFYDEDGMWLWLDRGIIEPDSVEVNYITAKKEGTLGVAMINTGANPLTTTITLGEKIPNASTFTETATLYDADGNKSTVEIVNGKFTVTIPAKGIQSVVLHPDVHVPAYVQEFTVSNSLGETAKVFEGGKAFLLQFDPNNYYAYIYTTKLPQETKSCDFEYTYGGKTYKQTVSEYPYETIIKVPAVNDKFDFKVTAHNIDGSTEVMGSETLRPITREQAKPFKGEAEPEPIVTKLEEFRPQTIPAMGVGAGNGNLRIVVPISGLSGFENVSENSFAGAKIKGILTWTPTGETRLLNSTILGNEIRNDIAVLLVNPTGVIPLKGANDTNYKVSEVMILSPTSDPDKYPIEGEEGAMTVAPEEVPIVLPDSFDAFTVVPGGMGSQSGNFRFVIPLTQIPFEVDNEVLRKLPVKLKVTEKETGNVTIYDAKILTNEMRGDATLLVIPFPAEFPLDKIDIGNNNYADFEIEILAYNK